ncbi:MAG: MBOAT family O-acyltransferase, partial [Candidatus Eremiobacterota bacterium]
LGPLIAGGRGRRPGAGWAALGVISNLALLVYSKYAAFGVANLNVLLKWLAIDPVIVPEIPLPLGVSFIVFEKITYVVDIHRGIAPPARSLADYLTYVFLFPKLLAGPIVKYHDIADQLVSPRHRYEDFRDGCTRFVVGLAKKVLLADTLAPVSDAAFATPLNSLDPSAAWLGLVCFNMQIYFDFSGYSDMAIGMGQMLGFRLRENFRDPYLSSSVTEFWRRWHISLSTWIKEYLYVPLGGNRVPTWRAYANLCLCFLLSGLWHGASWTFVIWGCSHGVALILDRLFWLRWQQRLPAWLNVLATQFTIHFTWVFFRCGTLPHALGFLAALVGATGPDMNDVLVRPDILTTLAVALLVVVAPLIRPRLAPIPAVSLAFVLALAILCTGRVTVNHFQPFLYFRF